MNVRSAGRPGVGRGLGQAEWHGILAERTHFRQEVPQQNHEEQGVLTRIGEESGGLIVAEADEHGPVDRGVDDLPGRVEDDRLAFSDVHEEAP